MGTPYTLKEFFLYESQDLAEAPSKYGDSDMADLDFGVPDPEKKRPDLPPPMNADHLPPDDPKHRKYYEILGKMLFAAQRRDSVQDEEERKEWSALRRKLTTQFDQLAKEFKLPTVKQLHMDTAKELGKD